VRSPEVRGHFDSPPDVPPDLATPVGLGDVFQYHQDEDDPHRQQDDESLGIEHIVIPGVVLNQRQVSALT
jgi:hypothetical protein